MVNSGGAGIDGGDGNRLPTSYHSTLGGDEGVVCKGVQHGCTLDALVLSLKKCCAIFCFKHLKNISTRIWNLGATE